MRIADCELQNPGSEFPDSKRIAEAEIRLREDEKERQKAEGTEGQSERMKDEKGMWIADCR